MRRTILSPVCRLRTGMNESTLFLVFLDPWSLVVLGSWKLAET